MLKVAGSGVAEAETFLRDIFAQAKGDDFICDEDEGASLHRFVTAGAAIRYRDVHTSKARDIVALDIALLRNDRDWQEHLPPDMETTIEHKLYYGHSLWHVMHQDHIVRKGNECMVIEHRMLELLDKRGAQYPAGHNVGYLYAAKPSLVAFYRALDPTNSFNPGLGKTSASKYWIE